MQKKIDVIVRTKNNEDIISKCIENIKKYIPYDRIILIDDSDDRTPEIAEKLGAEVFHQPALLGEKMFLGGKLAKTEWIANIDSDIFIYPNWWKELSKYMKIQEVGVINGWVESDFKNVLPSYEKYTKFISMWVKKKKGYGAAMGNALIRRFLLIECENPLKNAHAGEDTIFGKFIKNKGFKWITIQKITGFHYHKDAVDHDRYAFRRAGRSCVHNKGELRGIIALFAHPIGMSYQWANYSIHSHTIDLKLYKFLISLYIEFVKGVINEIKSPKLKFVSNLDKTMQQNKT